MHFDLEKIIIKTTPDDDVFQIAQNDPYYKVVARRVAPLMRSYISICLSNISVWKEKYGLDVYDYKPFYTHGRAIYMRQNAKDRVEKEFVAKLKENDNYVLEMSRDCQNEGALVFKESQRIKKTDYSSKSDSELQDEFKKIVDKFIYFIPPMMWVLSIGDYIEGAVKNFVVSKIDDEKKIEEYFVALTSASKENTGYYERVAILKLAKKYLEAGKEISLTIAGEIEKYIDEFAVMGMKYGIGALWTKEQVIERIKGIANKDPQKQLDNLFSFVQGKEDNYQKAIKELKPNKHDLQMIKTARELVFLRTYRTDVISNSFAHITNLIEEMGKRNDLSLQETLLCLCSELISFNFPDKSVIVKRAQTFISRSVGGKFYYSYGDEAVKMLAKIEKDMGIAPEEKQIISDDKEIRGVIAQIGIVTGIVKIVLDNSQLSKVNDGDIIVASMTTPDFVPAMEKASAFITDEGGILCHAAILSREMKKPCIIATKIATKILKDGDEVEVDAKRGIVTVIKNK